MALTRFPNGVFATPNLPGSADIPATTGTVYFVDSNGGTRGDAKSPGTAVATIDAAINLCTADKGDQIWVMPGHAENLANATTLVPDTDGIAIYGLGNAGEKPTITFTNASGQIDVTGNGTVISGLKFLSSVTAVTIGVDIAANDVVIENCEFNYDETGDDFAIMIDIDAYDRCIASNCKFIAEEVAGCNEAIRLDDAHHTQILNNWFQGDFTNSMIYTASGDATSNGLLVAGNTGYNCDTTKGYNIDFNKTHTGMIKDNHFSTAYAAAPEDTFDPGGCGCVGNTVSWAGDYNAFPVPWGPMVGDWRVCKKSVTYDGGAETSTAADAIGTAGTYGMFTISGTIEAKMVGIVGTSLTGASATISVGVTGDTDALLPVSTGTDLDANEVYLHTGGAASADQWTDLVHTPIVICGAASPSIFHTVATADVTTGQIDYHLYWRPLESGAYAKPTS